jgi:membrane protein YqaA with SNARE-associated domain
MSSYFESIWQFLSIAEVGLIAIGITSFLASTIMPLGSEPYLLAFLELHPQQYLEAVVIASIANTLGGVSTWYLGSLSNRFVSSTSKFENHHKLLKYMKKYGASMLIFSWLPVVGDVISGLAGWMKLPLGPCFIYMLIGKSLRYIVIAITFLQIR